MSIIKNMILQHDVDIIWYCAQEKFNPKELGSKKEWDLFVSETPQVKEYITLDGMLCPNFKFKMKNEDWDYIVLNGEFLTDFYTTPNIFLSKKLELGSYNLLAVIKEPHGTDRNKLINDFEFIGYDLLDKQYCNSPITNCGGFYDIYSRSDINEYGIFSERDFAYRVREELFKKYPEEFHADCYVFELWRMKIKL